MEYYSDAKNIKELKELIDNIENDFGENTTIESLTLVVKSDDFRLVSFHYEENLIYKIE